MSVAHVKSCQDSIALFVLSLEAPLKVLGHFFVIYLIGYFIVIFVKTDFQLLHFLIILLP